MVMLFAKKSLFSLALMAGVMLSIVGVAIPTAQADLSPRARAVVRDAAIGAAVGTGVGLVRTSNWWNSGNYNDRYYGGSQYNNRYNNGYNNGYNHRRNFNGHGNGHHHH